MWELRKLTDGKFVVLKIIGRIEADGLTELRKTFASQAESAEVVVDLAEVRLAGQDSAMFLAGCEEQGARLRNCPAYLREWIIRARNLK
jgi:anti-anti-sigma regulatory factor